MTEESMEKKLDREQRITAGDDGNAEPQVGVCLEGPDEGQRMWGRTKWILG